MAQNAVHSQTAALNNLIPLRLVLSIGETNPKTVNLKLRERLTLGWVEGEGTQPDLDFTTFGAQQRGMSHFHAAFVYEQDQLYIEDLNSENGTRINGFRIKPERRYRLRNGDELEFGSLRIVVRLARAP